MGDWDRNANWNRDVLEHIAALLFALAGVAELAAGAPFLRRRRVLSILRCGEAEARAFVMGVAAGAPALSDAPERAGDATGLAVRFRALAIMLCAMLMRRFASSGAAGSQGGRRRPLRLLSRSEPAPAPDTS